MAESSSFKIQKLVTLVVYFPEISAHFLIIVMKFFLNLSVSQ
jgi:hypothetical protein